jgi:hypothetical protein
MKDEFTERWETILPQAVSHFAENVKRIHGETPTYYEIDPKEWLELDAEEHFEYIMNDDYWVRIWSSFLFRMLINEIYQGKEFSFSLN